jgi:hypothetical protein
MLWRGWDAAAEVPQPVRTPRCPPVPPRLR